MADNWCEIFKTGTHKDSKGNTITYTQADLDKMKANFENVHNFVPICCGHPKTNSPAYGWFDKLKTEGGKLWATFKNVQPEFIEACKKGLFKNRSLSFTYPDLTIRHLAFLGAQAPAIKGLEQFCFSEEAENMITIEFSDETSQINDDKPAQAGATGGAITPYLNENKEKTEMENEELQNELKAKDEKIAELEAKLKKQEDEAKIKEFADWTDEMIKEGHILPSQKNMVIDILSAIQDNNFNFEDDAINAEKSFKEFVSGLKQIEFADVAKPSNVNAPAVVNFSDAEDIKEAILTTQAEYKNKGIDLTIDETLNKIKRGNN